MNGSITVVTGTLGGGKTLSVVETIVEHIIKGGTAYTNIDFDRESLRKFIADRGFVFEDDSLVFIEEGQISKFHDAVSGGTKDCPVIVAVDEAALDFNSRDWAKLDRALLEFNVLVRKLDIQMYYITQDFELMDKQVRRLAEHVIDCRNLRSTRIFFGIIPIPLPVFCRVYMRRIGNRIEPQHSEFKYAKSPYFHLYRSDALLGKAALKFSGLARKERKELKRIDEPKNEKPPILLWPFLILALFVVLF